MPKSIATKPFHVVWAAEEVERVRSAVRAYRPPRAPAEAGWRYGCDPALLERLCAHWVDGFDAQDAAATLNRYPQLTASVEGHELHAVHVVGEAQGRRPLLLVHGWPGSVFEFWQAIDALAFPSSHGGRPEDAFDLVIPSLPGFGFSSKPERPIGPRATAGLFDQLMRRALGYKRYLVQGGDWGAAVGAWLALEHRRSVEALHLNLMLVQPAKPPRTREEKAWQAALRVKEQALGAYASLQATRPQSLAYAMADNPVAQAAWIVERFHDWADLGERPIEEVFSLDQLLTNIMIYVMNDAFATGAWYYAGAAIEGARRMAPGQKVKVPTAFAAFPDPRTLHPPRSFMERGYKLVRWSEQPRGGHFAAMEVPAAFVQELRAWAAGL